MLLKLALVLAAIFVGAMASAKFATKTLADNRAKEWPQIEKSDPLSNAMVDWTIVDIRDDLGGIHNMLAITNGLLAGIITTLTIQFLFR
jgi:hypothetical protein